MATTITTISRPVVTFDGHRYTAEGSIIVIGTQTVTLGVPGTVYDTKGAHSIVVNLAGNPVPAVLDGTTEFISPFLTTSTLGKPTAAPITSTPAKGSPNDASNSGAGQTSNSQTSSSSSKSSNSSTASTSRSLSTSTSTASNSTTSAPSFSSNGLSSGAAAGIGIGCAAAGALIAALLVFLFMRKRRNARPTPREYSPDEKSPTSPQPGNANTRSLDPASDLSAFALAERDLPQPLEDAAIGGEMSRLQTLIKNYAQSYYHTSPVTTKNVDLKELGPNLPVPAPTLAAMLAAPKTRMSAIRFCLMWTIISRIDTDNEPSASLLPPEVSNLLRSMPTANHAQKPPTLAPWRALTHSLLTPSPSPSLSHNSASLQLALRSLDTILQPYADPAHDSYERLSKLEDILKRGARFGWTMFGEVAELGLEWRGLAKVGQGGEGGRFVLVEKLKGEGRRERVLWEGEEGRWAA